MAQIVIERFPQELMDLQEEVAQHPELLAKLAEQPINEFEIRIACVAAYCDVLLDGTYTPEDVVKLCALLTKKLYEKRAPIISLS